LSIIPRSVCRAPLTLLAAGALALAATGCSDLPFLGPADEQIPAGLELAVDDDLLTVGQDTPVRVTLLDRQGRAIENLPPWTRPAWTSTNPSVVEIRGNRLEAVGPGQVTLQATFGEQVGSITLRVNPESVRTQVHAYVTQAVQRWDGSVPLVAGRGGLLRVFVTADQTNFFQPGVRVRFFRNGTETANLVSPALDGIPVEASEGEFTRSFNLPVPGSLLEPGVSIVVETMPAGTLRLSGGSMTRLPETGTLALDVRQVPPFRIRFVPVNQPDAPTANLTPGNVEAFMAATRAVFPLSGIEVDVREVYNSSASTSTQAGWSQLLNEIRVLRALDGETAYYHGIVRRIAHWAGLGYIRFPAALSYDALPAANWTVAHELGHNFGRFHAPCGGPGNPDNAFPHSEGRIGVHGVNLESMQPVDPGVPDLMGYCQPRWISDYTYLAVLAYRAGGADRILLSPTTGEGAGLLLWGRIHGSDAVIEPALDVPAANEPPRPGPYRLVGTDSRGAVLFSASFEADRVSEGAEDERHFAFTLPVGAGARAALAHLRLEGPGVDAVRSSAIPRGSSPGMPGADSAPGIGARSTPRSEPDGPEIRATRQRSALSLSGPGSVATESPVTLSWDATRAPLLVVRNPDTGRVVALARSGTAVLVTSAAELDVEVADGVRTHRVRVPVGTGPSVDPRGDR
jgi:hypothetical protein